VSDDVILSIEDPRDAAGAALVAEMIAFIGRLYPEDTDEAEPPWTLADVARQGCFIVARVEGAVAGCGGLAPSAADGVLEIVRMYVRPRFRGRRIADRILEELERLVSARDASALMLRCGPRQPEALRLYEHNGYARRGVFAHHRDHPTNLFYEKGLTTSQRAREGL
jgi:putative acetyltransferase